MERIGSIDGGGILKIDPARLIDTRALIQGSSGSGKSWLVRLIVEKVAAKIPVLILDLEGEFVTLREQFDFVVAGEGGEVAVDVRSAKLLARKLLELKLSGVVSLYELDRPKRREYVRYFLESIMAAPREHWAPRLIVLDEAHEFAPEGGKSEASGAVIDLASRGRKRGYCLIAATQRMSKLDKDVVAECRNIFVGQTTLDVDVKRALDTLGFPADVEHKKQLRSLDHQFYAMGPATSAEGVVLFLADAVKTTHPESGLRRTLSPPEPSKRIRAALGELADLPKQAVEEAKTLADAQRRIVELERQVKAKPAAAPDERAAEKLASLTAERNHWKAEAERASKAHSSVVGKAGKAKRVAGELFELLTLNGDATVGLSQPADIPVYKPSTIRQTAPQRPVRTSVAASVLESSGALPIGEAKVLAACIQYPDGLDRSQLTVLTGYKRSSRDAYIARLQQKGLVDTASGNVMATPEGEAALPDAEPLPTGDDLQEFWRQRLPAGEQAILDVLISAYPDCVDRDALSEATGYKRSSRDAYIARMKSKQIITIEAAGVRASGNLF